MSLRWALEKLVYNGFFDSCNSLYFNQIIKKMEVFNFLEREFHKIFSFLQRAMLCQA